MKKLKLDLDALDVESFSVRGDTVPSGTVRGGQLNPFYPQVPDSLDLCDIGTTQPLPNTYQDTCAGQRTCAQSCNGTCNWACPGGTCDGPVCPHPCPP